MFLLCLCLIGSVQAKEKTNEMKSKISKEFILSPAKCYTTGEDNGIVKSIDGERIDLSCTLTNQKLVCGQSGTTPETYEVVINEEVFVARSKSGNVFTLGNLKKRTFSSALSAYLPMKGMLMTKHCSGIIK